MTTPATTSNPGTALRIWGIVLLVLSIPGGVLGLGWIITYYLTQSAYPIAGLGDANLLIGGFMFLGGIPFFVVGLILLMVGNNKRKTVMPE